MKSWKNAKLWRVRDAAYASTFVTAMTFFAAPWLFTACGSSNSDSSLTASTTSKTCDQSSQPTCPTTVPSYQTTVKGIISTYCLECHNPGGIGATATNTGGAGGGPNPNNANNPNFPNAGNANGAYNDRPANWDPNTARDWSDYNKILHNVVGIKQQVFLCDMPPSGATAMTDSDRATFLSWLACGAPNN